MPQPDIQDRLKELLEQASREQDAERVKALVEELLGLLAARQRDFEKPPQAN